MLEICERRVWAVPDLHDRPISPLYWRHRAARRTFDRIIFDIVEHRRRTGSVRLDLLGLLLDARDAETGRGMDDAQLREADTTLIVKGQEGLAQATGWRADNPPESAKH